MLKAARNLLNVTATSDMLNALRQRGFTTLKAVQLIATDTMNTPPPFPQPDLSHDKYPQQAPSVPIDSDDTGRKNTRLTFGMRKCTATMTAFNSSRAMYPLAFRFGYTMHGYARRIFECLSRVLQSMTPKFCLTWKTHVQTSQLPAVSTGKIAAAVVSSVVGATCLTAAACLFWQRRRKWLISGNLGLDKTTLKTASSIQRDSDGSPKATAWPIARIANPLLAVSQTSVDTIPTK